MLEGGMPKALPALYRRTFFYVIVFVITSFIILCILVSQRFEVIDIEEQQRLLRQQAAAESSSFLNWIWSFIHKKEKPKLKKVSKVALKWMSLFKFFSTCFGNVVKLPSSRIAFGFILAFSVTLMWKKLNISFPAIHRLQFKKPVPVLANSENISTIPETFQSPRSSVTCSIREDTPEFGFCTAVRSKTYSAGHIRIKVSHLPEIEFVDCEWKRIVTLHETAKLTGISTVLKYFKPAAIKVKVFPPLTRNGFHPPITNSKQVRRSIYRPKVLIIIQTLPQNPEASKIYTEKLKASLSFKKTFRKSMRTN